MEISIEVLKIMVLLLPGFITMKIVELKSDTLPKEHRDFLIDALIYSLIIYGLTTIVFSFEKTLTPLFLMVTLLLSILFGVIIGEAKNRDWFSSLFQWRTSFLSSQDKIFSIKATEKLFGKWHVIGLKNGKELCGIVREFNTLNNEMLVAILRTVFELNT